MASKQKLPNPEIMEKLHITEPKLTLSNPESNGKLQNVESNGKLHDMDKMKLQKPELILSERGKYSSDYKDFLVKYLIEASANPYHPIDNPQGIINMGTAVNKLMEGELSSRLNQDDCVSFSSNNQHYYDFSGISPLKDAVANFLTRHLHPIRPIISQNIMIKNGVSSCLDALSHVLCDPGDVIISPTPVYARIFTDFHDVSRTVVEPLHLSEDEDENGETFTLNADDLETRIESLRAAGKRVRGFILLNPQNPLGDVYSPLLIKELLHVCSKHKIHFISDEIYACSVFDESTKFSSVLTLDVPDPQRTHFLWGISKDFGLAGMRIGAIYSLSDEVTQALAPLSVYKCTPMVVQEAAATMLNDTDWCDKFFLPTSRLRLRNAYEWAHDRCLSMGLNVRRSKAGLFIWIGVHEFLQKPSEEEEDELLKELLDEGLYIVPGMKMYCSSPGWFRIVFSVTQHELEVGLERLEKVLKARRNKKKCNGSVTNGREC